MTPIDPVSLPSPQAGENSSHPTKIQNAAQQFESLLIGQILKSMQEASSSGWLGEEDQAGQAAMGLAQEQFAQALASRGGLGLARLITKGLTTESQAHTGSPTPE